MKSKLALSCTPLTMLFKVTCCICNVSRTQRHGLSLGNTITLRQCCTTFIGCQCHSVTKNNLQDRGLPLWCIPVFGLAPPYLSADCIMISLMPGQRQLRSAICGQLYIPRTRTMTASWSLRWLAANWQDSWDLPHEGSCTFQEPGQWHSDQGHSRSAATLCICSSFINLCRETFLNPSIAQSCQLATCDFS